MMAISLWTFLGRGKWASSVNGLCRLSHRSPWYHSASLYMCTGEGLLVGVKLFCYLLCSSLCFTFFGNEWPKSSIAQTVFVYLYNSCQGDIFSSSNGLVVSFLARGSLTLTSLQRGEPEIKAYDSYLCLHHGMIHRPLLHAPHHPEELCGAPLDAAQHPEELCTIDSLDLLFRLLIGTN